jgi:hypothetical protein
MPQNNQPFDAPVLMMIPRQQTNYVLPYLPVKAVYSNSITEEFGCSMVCACCVPQMLTVAHK